MLSKLLLLFLLFSVHVFVGAQTPSVVKKTEKDEKLIKAAIGFLRETSADVDRMRSIENRLSFGSELASLMWFHDEKSARTMYAAAIADFKLLLINLDAQINAASQSDDDIAGFSFFGPGKSTAERKLSIALMVRQQIALGLAEHDADMAFAFFIETGTLVSNPTIRESLETSDRTFENQLVQQIAESDVSKALKYGKQSLKDGIDDRHLELLKKIYAKDAEKGVEFAKEIVSRIRSDKGAVKNSWIYGGIIRYGTETLESSKKSGSKKDPVFSESDLRAIAEQFASLLLSPDEEDLGFNTDEQIQLIEKYSPSRAAQIRKKFNIDGPPTSLNLATNAGHMAAMAAMGNSNSMSNSMIDVIDPAEQEVQDGNKELADGMKSLDKPLSKEERDKVVTRSRTLIARSKGAEAKIAALTLLAGHVAKAGDKELSAEIMLEAERMVNPLPKNYRDYLLSWLLASGYAEADPEKAFPLLERTILRANETISAFAKVAEFIDVNEEMISDGEVQVGAFGGTMLRGMTRDVGIAGNTLVSLAKADFGKIKGLTESFDRHEVRVLAKMLVLRALLDEKKPGPPADSPALPGMDTSSTTR